MARDRSGRFGAYVPVEARIASGRAQAEARAKRAGRVRAPVLVDERAGRDPAWTFWGKAWCRHLERFGDIANRLPRGRTLLRNGSVVDLVIGPGRLEALVCGSMLYDVTVTIDRARPAQWQALVAACAGRIDSVVELLAGRISGGVMAVLTDPARGLFPEPDQIRFTCSCPDAARLCKHIAAVLYGVGARLDTQPELLFVLRDVDANALVEVAVGASGEVVGGAGASSRVLDPDLVRELFGVAWDAAPVPAVPEIAPAAEAPPRRRPRTRRPRGGPGPG